MRSLARYTPLPLQLDTHTYRPDVPLSRSLLVLTHVPRSSLRFLHETEFQMKILAIKNVRDEVIVVNGWATDNVGCKTRMQLPSADSTMYEPLPKVTGKEGQLSEGQIKMCSISAAESAEETKRRDELNP